MWKKLIVTSIMLALGASVTTFARDDYKYEELKNTYVDSELLLGGETTSNDIVYGVERSTALATAMCSITNEGSGVIGVFAETTMHKPVDWAYLTVYVERWYEDYESWQIEKSFEKEFLPEDEADGELTTATFSVDVNDLPSGYYYRVRALHELEFDGDWYEAKVTKTDGILITSAP